MTHPRRERKEMDHHPPQSEGGTNEAEETVALRSALGSIAKPPLSVGEVGVETMVVNSHVVKVPILIKSRQMTFLC